MNCGMKKHPYHHSSNKTQEGNNKKSKRNSTRVVRVQSTIDSFLSFSSINYFYVVSVYGNHKQEFDIKTNMIVKGGRLWLLLSLSAVVILAQDEIGSIGERIVGGTLVEENTYPWFTMIGFDFFGSFWRRNCGGALVSPEWVLTAAHCINDQMRSSGAVKIGAFKSPFYEGDNGGQYMELRNVTLVVDHPQYNFLTNDNDLALLRLDGMSKIKPVALDSNAVSESYKTGKWP